MRKFNRSNFHKRLSCVEVAILALTFSVGTIKGQPVKNSTFRGTAALADTRKAVSFGQRPSGSEAIGHLREWIISQLKPLNGQFIPDSFTAHTPTGQIPMANIIVKFPGTSGKAVVISGHYDTKRIPMVQFVGANDAGSSTGFLLEFARSIAHLKHPDDIYIVFFDGEEAVLANWSDTDSRYGSRHLVEKWTNDGTLGRIKALINIDMVGDKDLEIVNDANSSISLRSEVLEIATKLGISKYFNHQTGGGIDDDHKPFVDSGVNAIDIIDLDYGPNNSYWHTAQDTMDKLGAQSLQVVGNVILELVKQLEEKS